MGRPEMKRLGLIVLIAGFVMFAYLIMRMNMDLQHQLVTTVPAV